MITKHGLGVLFLILFIWNNIFAQDRVIEGKITDEEGNPISRVLVTVKGKDISVYSDKSGFFIIKLSPETITTLLFSHPEMQNTNESVGLNNRVDIKMVKKDAQNIFEMSLEEVLNARVITVSKTNEKQSDAPGIISVLTKEELDRFGGTTLVDILERIPGLSSGTVPYSNRTTIVVRGNFVKQNSSHVLILINSRPIREIQEGGNSSELLNTFPINIIEKIEVIRGPGSVLYGSDAFSGVINIITTNTDQNHASIAGLVEKGGFMTYGDVAMKAGDFNIVAAGQHRKSSIWDAFFSSQIVVPKPDPPGYILKDTTTILEIPDYGTGLFIYAGYKGLSIQSTFNQWHTLGTQILDNVINEKIFTNLGYNTSISDNWNIDINITYTFTKLFGENLSERNSKNLVAEWTNNVTFSEKSKLTIGGLVNNINGIETNIQDPENVMDISVGTRTGIALYTQFDYRVLENLKFIGGIQANKDGKMDPNIVSRGGVIWSPLKRLNIKSLYSQAYRAPSINELYLRFEGGLNGDENLKPEKVSTFDFGLNYQGERTQFGLSIFKSVMKDIIQPKFIDQSITRIYANLQSVNFAGGEVEGKYYVNQNIYFTGSVSYQTNRSGDEKNVTPIANFSAKGGTSIKTNNGVLVSLFNIYQGDPDEKYIGTNNPNQGAYNLLHLHSEYELNKIFDFSSKANFVLIFNIDNIFNREVYKFDWGGFNNDAIPAVPGRSIFVGIKTTI